MRRLLHAALPILVTLCLSGCADVMSGCSLVGPGPAFNVITRDQLGTGQALGALVTFHHDSTDSTYTAYRTDDSLSDYGGTQNRYYDIQVTKPYYSDGWARHTRTVPNKCGLGTSKVPVTIVLIPGSPSIRQMHLLPEGFWLDPANDDSTLTFRPFIDADPGISRAIRWTIAGDSTAATFDPATGVLRYHCQPLTTHMVVTATLLADTSFVSTSKITVQGHPISAGDTRCR